MNGPVAAETAERETERATGRDHDIAALLTWLAEHDEQCPMCGYNLRALTRPVCPECRQELVLTVGAKRVRLGWWIVAMVPGFFSGIAAILLMIPIVVAPASGGPPAPMGILALDAFGWLSGIAAIMLAVRRVWFLRLSPGTQRAAAVGVWLVHLTVFFGMLLFALLW